MIRGKLERQNSYPSIKIIEFALPLDLWLSLWQFYFFPGVQFQMWTPLWVWDLNPVRRLVYPRRAMLLLHIEASPDWHVRFSTWRVLYQAGILVTLLHLQPSWSPWALWKTNIRQGVSKSVQLNFFTSYLRIMHMTGLFAIGPYHLVYGTQVSSGAIDFMICGASAASLANNSHSSGT